MDKKVLLLLRKLKQSISEIYTSGLTTASSSSSNLLSLCFQEASKNGLLRLGSAIKIAGDELNRYITGDDDFSHNRLNFFLTRAWLLAGGLENAINTKNQDQWNTLMMTPKIKKLQHCTVITMGVIKRIVRDSIAAFEFRFKIIDSSDRSLPGLFALWSCVFPLKTLEFVPEAFLHLPRKQKFRPIDFLNKKTIEFKNCGVSIDNYDRVRINLGEKSEVAYGSLYKNWPGYFQCDYSKLYNNISSYEINPLELEMEFQHEVVFDTWKYNGEVNENNDPHHEISFNDKAFYFHESKGFDGDSRLDIMKKNSNNCNSALFSILYFDKMKCMIFPLTILKDDNPEYISIAHHTIDKKEIVRLINFT